MRVSDDRYQRDRTRLDVALRLIHHEARTRTIRQWTGLSDDRIRKLYRSYLSGDQGVRVRRRRGQSPHQAAFFTGTARLRQQSDLLASLYCLVGMLSGRSVADAPRLSPGIYQAQLLCQAFEFFGAFVGEASISFEHAAFLVDALANGQELALAHCRGCGAMVVSDRGTLREPCCAVCATDVRMPQTA
jgi:Flagellar transcriptional activator (FlhC)